MPILIQKKEKPIIELIKQHADKVLETVGATRTAFSLYFDGKIEESRMYTKKIHDLEREADIIEKKIEKEMFEGAFMPTIREAIYLAIEFVDKVAKRAEIIGDFLTLVHPFIPEEMHKHVRKMLDVTYECGTKLRDGVYNLFENIDIVFKNTSEVEDLEGEVDRYTWEALIMIFKKMRIEKFSHRMMLREMIEHISEVTNRMEDASEKLDVVALKLKS